MIRYTQTRPPGWPPGPPPYGRIPGMRAPRIPEVVVPRLGQAPELEASFAAPCAPGESRCFQGWRERCEVLVPGGCDAWGLCVEGASVWVPTGERCVVAGPTPPRPPGPSPRPPWRIWPGWMVLGIAALAIGLVVTRS